MNIDPVLATANVDLSSGASGISRSRIGKASTGGSDASSSQAQAPLPAPRQIEVNASFGPNNLVIYRIVDKDTQDLIQQIPPEQLLEIAKGIQQLLEAKQTKATVDITS